MVLNEDKENAINGKRKDSVREETNVVSGTTRTSAHNRHQNPLHPLNHKHKEVEVRREKEPQRPESSWEFRSSAVQRLLERYLHQIGL